MRKIAVVLVLLFLLPMTMGSCGSKMDPLLNYPGLSWGMTVEESVEALELPEDMAVTDYGRATKLITLENTDCMGQIAEQVQLFFYCMDDDTWCLGSVRVCYPENADMQAVEKEVRRCYGAPAAQLLVSPFPEYLIADEHNCYWGSTPETAGCQDSAGMTRLREKIADSVSYELTDSKWNTYLSEGAMTRIHWSDQYQSVDPHAEFQNVLIFQGSPLVEILWK